MTTIATLLTLLASPAFADTATLMKPQTPWPTTDPTRLVCYYEADGFIYHVVVDRGIFPKRCADTIETPFARIPPGWAVLLKDEVEAHENPLRVCYYGLAGNRLFIETVSRPDGCPYTSGRDYVAPSPPVGTATLRHEEDATTGSNTKLCLYTLGSSYRETRFTHYLALSRYTRCPLTLVVQ